MQVGVGEAFGLRCGVRQAALPLHELLDDGQAEVFGAICDQDAALELGPLALREAAVDAKLLRGARHVVLGSPAREPRRSTLCIRRSRVASQRLLRDAHRAHHSVDHMLLLYCGLGAGGLSTVTDTILRHAERGACLIQPAIVQRTASSHVRGQSRLRTDGSPASEKP